MPDPLVLPEPPYYMVTFSSQLAPTETYGPAADQMEALARAQKGFLAIESARGEDGFGITVCYWQDLAAIERWKQQVDHAVVQKRGREEWYKAYHVTVARVERAYGFQKPDEAGSMSVGSS